MSHRIGGTAIEDEGLFVIAEKCSQLRKINAHKLTGVTLLGLERLATCCDRLQGVDLDGCESPELSLEHIVKMHVKFKYVMTDSDSD